jgi:hypothetical protein
VSAPGLTFWFVGFLLGLRHALEPDHLAAVSNLALTSGRPLKAALAGALWGLGHLFTLAAVAGVALALGLRLPAAFGFLTELVVALALAWLGLSALLDLRVRRTMGPSYRSRSPLRNPFLWGVLHGLSGSAAFPDPLLWCSWPPASSPTLYKPLGTCSSTAWALFGVCFS